VEPGWGDGFERMGERCGGLYGAEANLGAIGYGCAGQGGGVWGQSDVKATGGSVVGGGLGVEFALRRGGFGGFVGRTEWGEVVGWLGGGCLCGFARRALPGGGGGGWFFLEGPVLWEEEGFFCLEGGVVEGGGGRGFFGGVGRS